MSELGGTSAVGIESVQWSAEAAGNLTLRVTGRWRRRRPISTGQPTLVIEADGRRHRFPAMPEPPSLGGTGPGVWRLSFTVPGALAPDLGRTWLQFGTVVVPLPVAVPAPGEPAHNHLTPPYLRPVAPASAPPSAPVPAGEPTRAGERAGAGERAPADGSTLAGGPARPAPGPGAGDRPPVDPPVPQAPSPPVAAVPDSPPPNLPTAMHPVEVPPVGPAPGDVPVAGPGPRPPAAATPSSGPIDIPRRGPTPLAHLAARVDALQRELVAAQAGRDELTASLAERERSRRVAEQRAHAEQALRQDLARRLSDAVREAERVRQAMGDLAAAEDRIRSLEGSLADSRRRSDEAEQVAAAATVARERAERERDRVRSAEVPAAAGAEAARVQFETGLRSRRAAGARWIPAEPTPVRAAIPDPPLPPPPPPLPEPPVPPPLPDPPVPPPLPRVPPAAVSAVSAVAAVAASGPAAPAGPADAGMVIALRRELDARSRAEAALRSRLVEAESRLAARVLLEQRTSEALAQLRHELQSLHQALETERARRAEAEQEAAGAQSRAGEAQTRADQAERRLTAVESRAARAEDRATEADERTAAADARAGTAERRLATAERRASDAEGRAADAEGLISVARARARDAEQRLGAADAHARDAERRVAVADARAREAEERVGAADARVREAEERVHAADARAAELERDLSGQRALSQGAYDAIGDLRQALENLSRPAAPDTAATLEADGAPETAGTPEGAATPEGAGTPEAAAAPDVGVPAVPAVPDQPGSAPADAEGSLVEPARLNDALSRLRETIAPREGAAESAAAAISEPTTALVPSTSSLVDALDRPTLAAAFRRLVASDPAAAGKLALELLPLQRIAYPHPVSYDLVLGEGRACVSVTVADGPPTIGVQSTPRPRKSVDFQVFGDPARIAKLLVAGRLRRRLRIGVARVRGRRGAVAALDALLGAPLDLAGLHRAGVRLDAVTALSFVAGMIEPAWTRGQRLTLAHTERNAPTTYLLVRDGRAIEVTRNAPDGVITATLRCPADELLLALSGTPAAGIEVEGDEAGIERLRGWIGQAQGR